MIWNLQALHAFWWEALWGGLREPGDLNFLQFLMLALTERKKLCWVQNGFPSPADPAAPGKVKPELCNAFSLCFSWDFSFAPIPYTLSFLQRAVPYSFWAWSQKHWDDKRSWKRVALILVSLGTLSVEIRENKPPKYLKKMIKELLMKSCSSLNWTGIFIINVIYFNRVMT